MKNKTATIAAVAVVAAIIAVVAVLGIKMANSSPSVEPVEGSVYNEKTTERTHTYPVISESRFEVPSSVSTSSMQVDISETAAQTVAQSATQPESTTLTEKVTQLTTLINKAFSEVFKMPQAPKYIPPDIDVNFDSASIASYMYDPDGNYYYTNDKDCWQSNFGFNEGYDSMAPVTMMYYDTVRTKFVYGGKEWLIQMWKGQYGYAFVGGEVGVYTRKVGAGGTHFNCAKQEDWLKMEMCFMWDENGTGEYRPVFNRDYTEYWWCTGFVVGFDGATNRHQFRLVTHITFKDEEMATAFCEAFEANGFKRVSSLNSSNLDSFVQVGADVGIVWQNIDQ
ncbi:MAG: DUF4474 domain-containing protein [Clostridia bacterium]|nr:DUF4474 domain-containing protein [Clostridia bacterium]